MPAMVGGFGSKKILMVYLKIAQRHIYKINFKRVIIIYKNRLFDSVLGQKKMKRWKKKELVPDG